jgi:ribokinase
VSKSSDRKRYRVVVLHDFFVDRIVKAGEIRGLLRTVSRKSGQGGGGVHDVAQLDLRGGNAVNMAQALGRLGTATYLVTHSDMAHLELLSSGFRNLRVKLSIKALAPGLTVAIEGKAGQKMVNVMLGHLGGAGDFPPSILGEEDWRVMRDADVVCIANWAANRHGTELVKATREQRSGKLIYLDPADVRDRIRRYEELLVLMKRNHLIDWLSANEFEALATARLLGLRADRLDRLCRLVAAELGVRFDLHTERASFTSEGKEVFAHVVKRTRPSVLTGAGDVWDAASVHFALGGRGDQERIALADTAARAYLSSGEHLAPTETEVLSLFEHS